MNFQVVHISNAGALYDIDFFAEPEMKAFSHEYGYYRGFVILLVIL